MTQFLTLVDCSAVDYGFGMAGGTRATYQAEYAITGVHLKNKTSPCFHGLSVRYSNLAEWLNKPAFEGPLLYLPNTTANVSIDRHHDIPLRGWPEAQIGFHYGPKVQFIGNRALKVRANAWVDLAFAGAASLQAALSLVSSIADFLTFVTASPTGVVWIAADPFMYTLHHHPQDVRIFRRGFGSKRYTEAPTVPLIHFAKVEQDIGGIMANWLSKRDVLKPVVDLYLGLARADGIPDNVRFLALSQAIEAYHRRRRPGLDVSEEKHKKRIAVILKSVPPEVRKWLKDKLEYSNELTLRKRIQSLFDEFADILARFKQDRGRFIDIVCNLRNYFTHYDLKTKRNISNIPDKIRVGRVMRGLECLLDICLMSELGLPREQIADFAWRRHSLP